MKYKFGLPLLLLWGAAAAAETVMEVIPLQNRPANEIQPLLQPLLEDGEAVIDNGFGLIVKSSPQRLESIRGLIAQLDTRLHNLTISVLRSSQKSAAELNAEAAVAISSDGIRMQGMAGNSRQLSDNGSVQQLRTLEGRAAHIEAGQQRPIENVTVYDSGYGYPAVSTTTQMRQATTGFAVMPRLVGNREVMIDIEPWSDRFLRSGAIASQNASTSVRAKLGEWVEIAGSNTRQQTDQQGYNGLNYSSRGNELRILIKVDLEE